MFVQQTSTTHYSKIGLSGIAVHGAAAKGKCDYKHINYITQFCY